jgi:outer membrane protein OmpA-like peptidoglycan-associated protein
MTLTRRIRNFGLAAGLATTITLAQVPNPTQTNLPETTRDGVPIFRTTVVSKSIQAINFQHRQGSTVIALEGGADMPKAKGEARIDSKTGATKIDLRVDKMPPAQSLGNELLTYVAWAITPEGRATNLGEVMLNGDDARLQTATELQAFGIVITAEPYYAVSQPSDMVVMQGVVKQGSTSGTISTVDAKYELLAKGTFVNHLPAAERAKLRQNKDVPLDLLEARHAMAIARSVGADRLAADTMAKASNDLMNAEQFFQSKANNKKIQSLARNVTQLAEDARIITMKKLEEEALQAERAAAAARVQSAQTAAEQELRKRELAEADRKLALENERQAQLAAERARAEAARIQRDAEEAARVAELARKEAAMEQERLRLQTEAARLAAAQEQARLAEAKRLADEAKAKSDAELAAARLQQEAIQNKLQEAEAKAARERAELLQQLNVVLQTRETARGLIVNMSDVLFDTAQFTLRPAAREKLARIAGIVLAHPGLKLEVEGHTDSVGDDAYNQRLSDRRADSVRSYLISSGISADTITAKGFGESMPVADNNTADGRRVNRRVELVVSGAPIQVTTTTTTTSTVR